MPWSRWRRHKLYQQTTAISSSSEKTALRDTYMPKSAKYYIHGVIAVGTALLAVSVATWSPRHLSGWLLYLALATLASTLKLRLPGLTRTYSLSFLFILFGVGHYSLPEVLVAGCAGALVQSVVNTKNRPTVVQVLFNMANLAITSGLCF